LVRSKNKPKHLFSVSERFPTVPTVATLLIIQILYQVLMHKGKEWLSVVLRNSFKRELESHC